MIKTLTKICLITIVFTLQLRAMNSEDSENLNELVIKATEQLYTIDPAKLKNHEECSMNLEEKQVVKVHDQYIKSLEKKPLKQRIKALEQQQSTMVTFLHLLHPTLFSEAGEIDLIQWEKMQKVKNEGNEELKKAKREYKKGRKDPALFLARTATEKENKKQGN